MPPVDLTRLQYVVWRYVRGEELQRDVFQQAWVLAQTRGTEIHYKGLVMDAMRSVMDPKWKRLATGRLSAPNRIASLYPTEAQLRERWEDEETEDQIEEWLSLPAAERDARRKASRKALGTSPETEVEEMGRRDGELLFKEKPHEWGRNGVGSTGDLHPFRRRAAKQVREAERRAAADREITMAQLEEFGVPFEDLEHLEQAPLDELDRFVEAHGLEQRGIDVVLSRFERSRYERDEEDTDGLA